MPQLDLSILLSITISTTISVWVYYSFLLKYFLPSVFSVLRFRQVSKTPRRKLFLTKKKVLLPMSIYIKLLNIK